jgi:hypothetical protein
MVWCTFSTVYAYFDRISYAVPCGWFFRNPMRSDHWEIDPQRKPKTNTTPCSFFFKKPSLDFRDSQDLKKWGKISASKASLGILAIPPRTADGPRHKQMPGGSTRCGAGSKTRGWGTSHDHFVVKHVMLSCFGRKPKNPSKANLTDTPYMQIQKKEKQRFL